MAWKKELSVKEKEAYREKKKEEMSDLFRKIDNGVKAVFESEKYKEYLRVMSKFTHYSAGNCLLIAMQKPDASLVAAYGKWKSLGRQVNRGETGIRIFAPMPYKLNCIEFFELVHQFFSNQNFMMLTAFTAKFLHIEVW